MATITERIHDRIYTHTVNKAVETAARSDDYRLSRLMEFLPIDDTDEAIAHIAHTLGRTGYMGAIYVEQANLGNSLRAEDIQDVTSPRVHIESRNGESTSTEYVKQLGSSVLTVLARFPETK